MKKPKVADGAIRAAIKEDLTMIRDTVNTVRDEIPDVDGDMPTTANARRALRKAIYKGLTVLLKMHKHSDLPEDVRTHRITMISRLMASLLLLRQAPVDQDGDTEADWQT